MIFAPFYRPLKTRMRLIATDSKDIKVYFGQRLVDILIDNDFVNDPESLNYIDPLLGRIQHIRVRLGLKNAVPVLNSNDQIVSELSCILKEPQMAQMKIIKHTHCDHFFQRDSPLTTVLNVPYAR